MLGLGDDGINHLAAREHVQLQGLVFADLEIFDVARRAFAVPQKFVIAGVELHGAGALARDFGLNHELDLPTVFGKLDAVVVFDGIRVLGLDFCDRGWPVFFALAAHHRSADLSGICEKPDKRFFGCHADLSVP